MEMIKMISAKELRKRTDQSKFKDRSGKTIDDNMEQQNKEILKASEQGRTYVIFDVSSCFKDEIKQRYKELGYTFRPVGYCGGVWQDSEYICW